MTSIPPQFIDTGSGQQLRPARALREAQQRQPQELHSGIAALDDCFSAIRPGDLIEWGIPPGLNGRLIPLQLLKHRIPPSVWIYHHQGLGVLASSWISHGVDLQRLFFICSDNPVGELRPLFLEDTFKRIVIDSPRRFSCGDMAFVSQRARQQAQVLFLIRPYFLSEKHGNPYASLRINAWQDREHRFSLRIIKGKRTGVLSLPCQQVAETHGSQR